MGRSEGVDATLDVDIRAWSGHTFARSRTSLSDAFRVKIAIVNDVEVLLLRVLKQHSCVCRWRSATGSLSGFKFAEKKRDIAVHFCLTRPARQEIDGITMLSWVSGIAQLAARFGRAARTSAALSRAAGLDADVVGKMHIPELLCECRLA